MSKRKPFVAGALVAGVIACTLGPVDAAADVQSLLNAPALQLDYEVTFKAASEWPGQLQIGPVKYTAALQSAFSAGLLLDLRTSGPSLSTMKLTLAPTDGPPVSAAEQQRAMMELIMRTETMGSWMSGGPLIDENASYEEQQAAALAYIEASRATARLDYTFVMTGAGLVNEMGTKYDLISRRTLLSGSGKVTVATGLNFELDAQTHHYMLTLAHEFSNLTGTQAKKVTIDTSKVVGEPPVATRTEEEVNLNYPSTITIDDPMRLWGTILLIEGDFDPSAEKITGERSIPAHFVEGGVTVPGTLLVRFTLTPR